MTGGEEAIPSFVYLMGIPAPEGENAEPPAEPVTAGQVLDHHVQLHDLLAHPNVAVRSVFEFWGEKAVPAALADPMLTFYPHYVLGQPGKEGWAARFCGDLARGLFTSLTYQVTADMCRIAEAMYEETARRAVVIEESDLPAETGFLWLDKPYRRAEAEGHLARFRALCWSVLTVRIGGEPHRAVRVTWWADWLADPAAADTLGGDQYRKTLDLLGPLFLASTITIPFGRETEYDAWSNPLCYAYTLWLLLGSEIAATDGSRTTDRGSRRRALKSIRHGEVSVITLRRGRGEGEQEHREIDWSCRWLVRGFWRHLESYLEIMSRHEARGNETGHCGRCGVRVTWVRPYVKGPEDRPLKAIKHVYRLSR